MFSKISRMSRFFGILLALALVAALSLGIIWTVTEVIVLFSYLRPEAAAVAGISSIVALLAATLIANGIRANARQTHFAQTQIEKATTYMQMLEFWEGLLRSQGSPAASGTGIVAETMRSIELRLALYGSLAAINAHRQLVQLLVEGRLAGEPAMRAFLEAALALRAEVGARDAGSLVKEALRATLFNSAHPLMPVIVDRTGGAPHSVPPEQHRSSR